MRRLFLIIAIFSTLSGEIHAKITVNNLTDAQLNLSGDYYTSQEFKDCASLQKIFPISSDPKFMKDIEVILKEGIKVWFTTSHDTGARGMALPSNHELAILLNGNDNGENKSAVVLTPSSNYCVFKHELFHLNQYKKYDHFTRKNPAIKMRPNDNLDSQSIIYVNNYLNEVGAYEEDIKCLKALGEDEKVENKLNTFNYLYLKGLEKVLRDHPNSKEYICDEILKIYSSINFNVCKK